MDAESLALVNGAMRIVSKATAVASDLRTILILLPGMDPWKVIL
jgi:hypothetical protein